MDPNIRANLQKKLCNRINSLPKKIKYGVPAFASTVSLVSTFINGMNVTDLHAGDLLSRMKDRFTEAVGIDYKFTHVVTTDATPITRENTGAVKAAYDAGDCVVVRYDYKDGQSRIVQMGISGAFNYSMIAAENIRPLAGGEKCPNAVTDQPPHTTLSDLQKLGLYPKN